MTIKVTSKFIIDLLQKKNGKSLSKSELLQLILSRSRESLKKGRHKRRAKRMQGLQEVKIAETEKILSLLIQAGVLFQNGKKFTVVSPGLIQGTFQSIRRGGGFVQVDDRDMEVYIAEQDGHGVLDRDYVLVQLSHIYREKWEGEVIQILRSGRKKLFGMYLGQDWLESYHGRRKKFYLVQIFDNPGFEYAVIEREDKQNSEKKSVRIRNKRTVNLKKSGKKDSVEFSVESSEDSRQRKNFRSKEDDSESGSLKYLTTEDVAPGSFVFVSVQRDSYGFPRLNEFDVPLVKIRETVDRAEPKLDLYRVANKHGLTLEWAEMKYLQELENLEKQYPEEEQLIRYLDSRSPWPSLRRIDHRDLFTVTIDGDDAKDFDDAISHEIIRGEHHLYVHIADLSLWLEHGSDLDREAVLRGNSTYLQNYVIPMLPPFLSERHCSLRADEVKAAFTCHMILDKNMNLDNYEFYPSLIQVNYRLTYNLAEGLLRDKAMDYPWSEEEQRELAEFLHGMEKITLRLRKLSFAAGRLDLNIPEVKISADSELDEEHSDKYSLYLYPELGSNHLIEELMLAANRAAAELLKSKEWGALYRVHEKPDFEKLYILQNELQFFGLKWEWDEDDVQGSFVRLSRLIQGHRLESYFSFLVLRSLKQAQYVDDAGIGHFGLGFSDYLHFTSPIRRYPDLVVHRQLKNLLTGKDPFYSEDELHSLGKQLSATERLSMDAERDMTKLALCRAYQHRVGESFRAMITGVNRNGFFITLEEIPVEGRLLFENIFGDYFIFYEEERAAIGERSGLRLQLGSSIELTLEKSNWDEMYLDFSLEV